LAEVAAILSELVAERRESGKLFGVIAYCRDLTWAEDPVCSWSQSSTFARTGEAAVSKVEITKVPLGEKWRIDVDASASSDELGSMHMSVKCAEP